jgi:ABC-type transporter Mla subunit MlaD
MTEAIEAAADEAATAASAHAPAQDDPAPDNAAAANPETETPEPEMVEYRFGAKVMAVPRGTLPDDVDANLREFAGGIQADYTRKTQALAEEGRALEAERASVRQIMTLTGEAQRAAVAAEVFDAEAKAIRAQLPQLWQSNPDQARQLSDQAAQMEAAAVENRQLVAGHQAKIADQTQRESAKRLEAGIAEVRQAIKGFDEKAEGELIRYAVTQMGVSEADARAYGLTPKLAVAVWKASQWDRLQAQTKAATAATPPAPPSAPVKGLSGKSVAAAKDPQKMSDDEWVKWRNAQIAKRR